MKCLTSQSDAQTSSAVTGLVLVVHSRRASADYKSRLSKWSEPFCVASSAFSFSVSSVVLTSYGLFWTAVRMSVMLFELAIFFYCFVFDIFDRELSKIAQNWKREQCSVLFSLSHRVTWKMRNESNCEHSENKIK